MTSFQIKNDNECQFKFWAPNPKKIQVVSTDYPSVELSEEGPGIFGGELQIDQWPFLYSLNLGDEKNYPDPKSVFLPSGVHGPSEIDNKTFEWTDDQWTGVCVSDLVIYELHVGAFSQNGSFDGCRRQLDYLQDLGITAIELMPLAQCPGRWNWGYDGVGLWAVNCNYGRPNDLRRLIDECHDREISVIHDVVYNHVGPEGNYLGLFGNYFSGKHRTPWGSAFDFDGVNREHARKFVIDNALFWLQEYHFDGLRLDAIHYMFDESDCSIQQELCDRVREYEASTKRSIHLIGEANIYDHSLIVEAAPHRYSAIWADDLMHAIHSSGAVGEHLTPRSYQGASDVEEALSYGYLYQGPRLKRVTEDDRKKNHGATFDSNRGYLESLIVALQTHDSVGNHPQGKRIHQLKSPSFQAAAIPLILLYPSIPMIFMGEEFASDSPFMFFADFIDPKLRKAVDRGRTREYPHHDWSNSTKPSEDEAYYQCKLELPESENKMLEWYRRLIDIRKQWKQRGVLAAARLVVSCNPERHVFCLRYENGKDSVFVISRLEDPNPEPIVIELNPSDGRFILDSKKHWRGDDSELSGLVSVSIQPNHAVVGLGSCEFAGLGF